MQSKKPKGNASYLMKPRFCLLIIALIFILLVPQISLATGQEFKMSVKRDINNVAMLAAVDFRRDEGHLFRKHYDIGARIPIDAFGEGWSAGFHYRFIYTAASEGGWNLEKRPYVQLQKKFKTSAVAWFPELKWALRTRQEFRFRQQKQNSQRNRLKITAKSTRSFFNAYPFIANEYYYDFLKDDVTKVNVELGMEFSKIKGIKPSLYYKQSSTYKNKEWWPYSGIVLKLAF